MSRLISSRPHICQKEQQHLIDPMAAADVERGYEQDPLYPVITAYQFSNYRKKRHTDNLQNH